MMCMIGREEGAGTRVHPTSVFIGYCYMVLIVLLLHVQNTTPAKSTVIDSANMLNRETWYF